MTTLLINGKSHEVDVDDSTPLLWVIRDVVGHTGAEILQAGGDADSFPVFEKAVPVTVGHILPVHGDDFQFRSLDDNRPLGNVIVRPGRDIELESDLGRILDFGFEIDQERVLGGGGATRGHG